MVGIREQRQERTREALPDLTPWSRPNLHHLPTLPGRGCTGPTFVGTTRQPAGTGAGTGDGSAIALCGGGGL